MHGFDEFFGNLYHLNAEEEPEQPDYPTEEEIPNFRERFGPRGVIHSWANGDGDAAHRGHRPADHASGWRPATRSSATPPSTSSGVSTRPTRRSSSGSTPRTCTSAPTPATRSSGAPAGGSPSYHDTMVDHDEIVGQHARRARRAGHRRRHDRHVLHRQRSPHELVARRRHDPVPQREELQLGGRLPGARASCAGRARSRPGRCSTASSATTTGS